MLSYRIFAATAALLVAAPAVAQDVKVAIGISGWTGFAPLTLANQAGIFKKNGLDVTIKKIPQKDRHLAVASGDIQCAATTVETWISWNANGVATKQIFQLDKSYGADGMATRSDVASIKDLKGKTVAASAPGTAPYFTLAWMLKKNGLSIKDVTVVNLEPAAAAQAFVAGQNDAAQIPRIERNVLEAAHEIPAHLGVKCVRSIRAIHAHDHHVRIGPFQRKCIEGGRLSGRTHMASQENPLPARRIFPVDGEGKCAVQHSVAVSQ